jgi:tetratricopeptide (TPR) repeat protein
MRCIDVEPARSHVYFALAAALERLGREREIIDVYTRLSAVRPDLAAAHFNRAVYLRRFGRLDEAAVAYRVAIDLGIEGKADAWSNLGVVLGELERHDESRDAFARAIAADAQWTPALYNLGLLHEEFGEREAALEQFERVLAIDPDHHDAFARLVRASIARRDDDAIAERVRLRLQRTDLSPAARETLSFALGDALDAHGRHDEAFAAYATANAIARGRAQPYDRVAEERDLAALAVRFGPPWPVAAQSVSTAPLVFVCGMWRSGTTLLERMLGGHPALTSGGEISYFSPSAVNGSIRLAGAAADASAPLRSLGQGYVAMLEQRFPGCRVIDKRPDTWRYLGLLHGLFPEAKFIVMQRDPLDTCLSIFFQQLDAIQLPFTTDLGDIAHHLCGCRALVRHWRTLFPDQILEVQYEELVNRPEQTLEIVCGFLGLAWNQRMLEFPDQRSRVRTASVWQVREPVHSRSVGRWHHYREHLRAIVGTLGLEQHEY